MTDPRSELQRVVNGELAVVNILHLAKQSGYVLYRVREIAKEMGLHVSDGARIGNYLASLPPVEGQGRKG